MLQDDRKPCTFGLAATAWHKGWGEVLLIALVLLHLLAVVYHVRIARRTLVRPMLRRSSTSSLTRRPDE